MADTKTHKEEETVPFDGSEEEIVIKEKEPVEDERAAFNCDSCHGLGLIEGGGRLKQGEVCTMCGGTGKVK